LDDLRQSKAGQPTRRSFLANTLTLGGGTGLAQGLLILSTPFLSRIFTPEAIGDFGIYYAVVSFAIVLAPLGYPMAVVSSESDGDAIRLTLGAIALAVLSSVVAVAGMGLLRHLGWFGFQRLSWGVLPLGGLAILITASFEALRLWFVRSEDFGAVSRAVVLQGAGRAVGPLPLGLAGLGTFGLVLGDLLGRGLGVGALVRRFGAAARSRSTRPTAPDVPATLWAYRRFPATQVPSRALNTLATLLPVPMVMALYGPQTAGLYVMMERVLSVPVSFVGRATGDVFHARLALLRRESPREARRLFYRTGGFLAVLAVPMVALLMFVGPEAFALVLGDPWREAGVFAAILAPWAGLRLVVAPLSMSVFVYEALRLKLLYDVLALTAVVGAFGYGRAAGLDVQSTLTLLVVLGSTTYLVYYLLLLFVVRREGGQS